MSRWLLDTGPIVAYLDRRDPWHSAVAAVLDGFDGKLITTSAVVTEAMYMVRTVGDGPSVLVEFLNSARVEICECTNVPQLSACGELMRKYSDVPMDFADATLVLLGESLKISEVCTLNRRGFKVFRNRTGRPLELMIEPNRL